MYIWKIKKLEEDLIAGSLPETESIKYLTAFIVLFSLAAIPYGNENIFDSWNGVLVFFTSLLGLFFVYKANGGSHGKHIIERYVAVGWVVFVRLLVLFLIPALIAMMVVQEIYLGGIPNETSEIHIVLTLISEIVFYIWFTKHMKNIAQYSLANG